MAGLYNDFIKGTQGNVLDEPVVGSDDNTGNLSKPSSGQPTSLATARGIRREGQGCQDMAPFGAKRRSLSVGRLPVMHEHLVGFPMRRRMGKPTNGL